MAPNIRSIVVGVDSRDEPDRVLERAAELARALGAALHVVHGYMIEDPLLDAYARSGFLGEDGLVNHGREMRRRVEPLVAALGDEVTAISHIVAGPPAMALTDVAGETGANLIIVGATRRTRIGQKLIGSTARATIRRSTIPVLMMRPEAPAVPRRILSATDLGPISAAAYELAVSLAMSVSQPVTVRSLLVVNDSLTLLPIEKRLLLGVAENELAEFVRQFPLPGEEVERKIRAGDPAAEVLAEAQEWNADLITLGTESRTGMNRVLLGSVAEAVLEMAPCNVLITPGQSEAEEEAER
jgi:nucleotide-binding universal stress UspA family protein